MFDKVLARSSNIFIVNFSRVLSGMIFTFQLFNYKYVFQVGILRKFQGENFGFWK